MRSHPSGGVGVGEADFTKTMMKQLGDVATAHRHAPSLMADGVRFRHQNSLFQRGRLKPTFR